jgi:hypothetical protein
MHVLIDTHQMEWGKAYFVPVIGTTKSQIYWLHLIPESQLGGRVR